MSSPTLLRLIDEAISPAVILVVGKVLGIILASAALNYDPIKLLKGEIPLTSGQYVQLTSYASFVMVVLFFLCFSYVIFSAFHLHETHIHPSMAKKLVHEGLSALVVSSLQIYHQLIIWGMFALLTSAILWIYAYYGFLHSWVAVTAMFSSIIYQWLIVIDIEREFKLHDKEYRPDIEWRG